MMPLQEMNEIDSSWQWMRCNEKERGRTRSRKPESQVICAVFTEWWEDIKELTNRSVFVNITLSTDPIEISLEAEDKTKNWNWVTLSHAYKS
jgi:hypothetical protein